MKTKHKIYVKKVILKMMKYPNYLTVNAKIKKEHVHRIVNVHPKKEVT